MSLLKLSLIYIKSALKIYIFTAVYFHVYVALRSPDVVAMALNIELLT